MNYFEIESAYEALYDFAMQKHNQKHIKAAELEFVKNEDHSDIEGFNEWFIFNYIVDADAQSLVEQYARLKGTPLAQALASSYRGVFEVSSDQNGFFLQDIFSRDLVRIDNSVPLDTGLMSLRVVSIEDSNFVIGDMLYYDDLYKDIIVKYVLEQYNQHCVAHGPIEMPRFLAKNSMLIFKMSRIMTDIYEENIVDEDYLLYESVFAFNEAVETFIERLMSLSEMTLYVDEEDDHILRMLYDDRIIAELEIIGSFVNILCNCEYDQTKVLSILKPLENERFVFVKSQVLTIDEFL